MNNTNKDRLNEVLNKETIEAMFSYKSYKGDATEWMKEHIKTHNEWLDRESPAVMVLPFHIELSACGLGNIGHCVCDICKKGHSITNMSDF